MYKSHYNIAGISIVVTANFELADAENYTLYRAPDIQTDQIYEIELKEADIFPNPEGSCVFQNEMNAIFYQEPVLHYYNIPFAERVSEWDYLEDGNQKVLHYHPETEEYFRTSLGVFNAAGFERILYLYDKFLFHCSYVDYQGKAILFSAPSGGGKTTQGLLWEKHAGATMINGDRAVLEKTGNGVICHGLPIAGSSGVFINRSLPLSAIFIPKKAQENSVVRLSLKEVIYAIYSQLTINTWNQRFIQDALDFAIYVASTVPVYQLSCTISQKAVEVARSKID